LPRGAEKWRGRGAGNPRRARSGCVGSLRLHYVPAPLSVVRFCTRVGSSRVISMSIEAGEKFWTAGGRPRTPSVIVPMTTCGGGQPKRARGIGCYGATGETPTYCRNLLVGRGNSAARHPAGRRYSECLQLKSLTPSFRRAPWIFWQIRRRPSRSRPDMLLRSIGSNRRASFFRSRQPRQPAVPRSRHPKKL